MIHRLLDLSCFDARHACPACSEVRTRTISIRTVFRLGEDFGELRVAFAPEVERIRRLLECERCGLWYFSHVPNRNTLTSVIWAAVDGTRWEGADRPAFVRARREAQLDLKTGAILDIGSHDGAFLKSLEHGWTRFALDPSPVEENSDSSRVHVIPAFLDDAALPEATFHVVTAFDVFEHLQSPAEAVARIYSALAEGGTLIIETGNSQSGLARWLRAGWYYFRYIEHFQAFSPRSLTHLLENNGFRMRSVARTFHDSPSFSQYASELCQTAVFAVLAARGSPMLWRALNRSLRPGHNATPPASGALERDHFFLIAEKV